jgi:hypothetical protein
MVVLICQNKTTFAVPWGWFELFQIFSLNWHNVKKNVNHSAYTQHK